MIFRSKNFNFYIELSDDLVKFLDNFKQSNSQKEAGGQLFAKTNSENISIVRITGPSSKDLRKKHRFIPCMKEMNKDIDYHFKLGYHYVGDWHSHPEPYPSPSSQDISTMKSIFIKSSHNLNFLILLILSNLNVENSYLGIIDKKKCSQFKVE